MATSAKEWKRKSSSELTLPSGNVCQARRVDLSAMITSGRVPNALLPHMKGALTGKAPDAKDLKEVAVDEATVLEMLHLFDVVAIDVMVDPQCHPMPEAKESRDPDSLYVDELDMEDKQFLFQWAVGGTSDVEKFREQSAQLMDALQPGEGVERQAKPTARTTARKR